MTTWESDLVRFEEMLARHDFELLRQPDLRFPPGVDGDTKLRIRRQANAAVTARNVGIILDYLKRHPEVMRALCDLYMATAPAGRAAMRRLVAGQRRWLMAFRQWEPPRRVREAEPGLYARLCLASLSLAGGLEDDRSTLSRLATLWREMEAGRVDPKPHYHTARAWGGPLGEAISVACGVEE